MRNFLGEVRKAADGFIPSSVKEVTLERHTHFNAMRDLVLAWWDNLSYEAQSACKIMKFSNTIITSLLFFDDMNNAPNICFSWGYNDFAFAIAAKIKEAAITGKTPASSLFTIPSDNYLYYERLVKDIQKENNDFLKRLSPKVAEMVVDDLIKNDELICFYEKAFNEWVHDYRCKILNDVINNLPRILSNREEKNGE